jgi:hypothetical protein
MLIKAKIGLALALVLGGASAAMAATKHHSIHHFPAAAYEAYGQAPAAAPQGFGYSARRGQVERIQGETGGVLIQDRDTAATLGAEPEHIW